jgi:hypothetical protein
MGEYSSNLLHKLIIMYISIEVCKFRIQSVAGDHFSNPNMEIKKNRDFPHKDALIVENNNVK